jgi:PAS domain S-box-containing protein
MVVSLTRVRDHRYVDVSECFERWTGWRRDDVIGRNPFDIGLWVNPAERSEFEKRLAEGVVYNLEVHYRRKDGAEMVGLGSAKLIEIENEPCALSFIADISERKQTEEALKESESRFRLLADSAPALIWMSGTDKLCCYFNRRWLDFTGRPMESELGNGWTEGVHVEDFERCLNTYTRAFDRREEFRMEYRLRRHDGEYRWVLDIGIPRFDPSHAFLGYVGIAVDVADRKMADEIRLRYAAIVESSDDAIIGVDEKGVIASWNRGAEQLFGYSTMEAIGRNILFLSPEDRPDDGQDVLKKVLKGEVLRGYETERQRKDGTCVDVSLTASPIVDAEGGIVGVSAIAHDITERKRTEAALLRSEKLASLGRMAAAIAHEINNPLAAVTNLLFLAKETKELPESPRRLLEMADEELRRVAHIARKSLAFYRESNAPALISVGLVLDSVLDLLKNKIKEKQAIIDKQAKGDVQITAVEGELRQVFSNLVSNSLDAIDERGILKVRVSAGKDRARVTLADNGKGIPARALEHIFEPFFTTKDRVGIGLGLWVSQQIIEKHSGKIQVRSRSEGSQRGTTFSIVLPVAPTPAEGQLAVAPNWGTGDLTKRVHVGGKDGVGVPPR